MVSVFRGDFVNFKFSLRPAGCSKILQKIQRGQPKTWGFSGDYLEASDYLIMFTIKIGLVVWSFSFRFCLSFLHLLFGA